jgi:hypothetical protein
MQSDLKTEIKRLQKESHKLIQRERDRDRNRDRDRKTEIKNEVTKTATLGLKDFILNK